KTATGKDLNNASNNGPPATIRTFFLRQLNAAPFYMVIDEVRVGTSWADVTPIPCHDPRFDVDGDTDVDLDDFAALQLCYGGPASAPGCRCFDKSGDGTIDGADVTAFMNCAPAGGTFRANVPADPNCDN